VVRLKKLHDLSRRPEWIHMPAGVKDPLHQSLRGRRIERAARAAGPAWAAVSLLSFSNRLQLYVVSIGDVQLSGKSQVERVAPLSVLNPKADRRLRRWPRLFFFVQREANK
jgi:hypothetical protein